MARTSLDRTELDREHIHSLLLLYLAVAYGADHDLDEDEESAIQRLLQSWLPEASDNFVAGMVRAALDLYKTDHALSIEGLALGLRSALALEFREQILKDMVRVARADGEQSTDEAAVIARVRAAWEN